MFADVYAVKLEALIRRLFFATCIFIALGYVLIVHLPNDCGAPCPRSASLETPLIFVGGHPRSGTTLLRILLDVHPMIRCGPETHILPKLMENFRTTQVGYMRKRLDAANLSTEDVNHAFAAFIRFIIEKAGSPAPILCNKDPLMLTYLRHLHGMFPTAKFLHIVRDGRAVTASMIKRKIKMGKLGREKNWDAFALFKRWEKVVDGIERECRALKQCHTIHYEDLVLKPKQTMQDVLSFLDVPWDPVVLHHENFVNKTVFLSSMEPSTNQVVNPLYMHALSSWVSDNSTLPQDFIYNVHKHSDVLRNLGYDKFGIPPVYGQAELAAENQTRGQYIIKNFH
ncbi:hypothetical protein EG68_01813 [Paragonimus skrjabini miyazakii]|uniref:Protein-tyrosine sulfotransferase n=1 Tax=Paragonimus skrjabini miyazakii TaxID=59628 RepID=A0A8S9Z216_9TREM|nr:hypothetical protein EG68_01813 [Paragonimus skrjabini miyazakii]